MSQTATIDLINTILISAGIGICGMCLLHIATSTELNKVIRRYFLLFFPVLLLNSDSDSGYLIEARNLAYYHHEKWNGEGYPQKLSGEYIPLSARIMAVADVFDALVSKRSYKEPFSVEQAILIIQEGSGTDFDPKIVTAFLHAQEEIRRIATESAGA